MPLADLAFHRRLDYDVITLLMYIPQARQLNLLVRRDTFPTAFLRLSDQHSGNVLLHSVASHPRFQCTIQGKNQSLGRGYLRRLANAAL